MHYFQDLFDKELHTLVKPEIIVLGIFRNIFSKHGISLTRSQIKYIISQIKTSYNIRISFDLTEKQVLKAGYTDKEDLENGLQQDLDSFQSELEKITSELIDRIPSMMEILVDDVSFKSFYDINRKIKKYSRYHNNKRFTFNKEITKVWKEVFDLLDVYILFIDDNWSHQYDDLLKSSKPKSDKIDAINRLFARAIQVIKEIVILLKNGFPDGAHARWRTLHEISIVVTYLYENSEEVSKKYLLHQHVESYKAANIMRELNRANLSDSDYASLETKYNKLIEEFGVNYKNEYGWAADSLVNPNPKFYHIEKAVSLQVLRSYYKLASHNVHANSKALFFKLGLLPEDNGNLLTGQSYYGFYDPISNTIYSMQLLNAHLFTLNSNIDKLIVVRVAQKIAEKIINCCSSINV
jgi:hypothetical protein